MYNSTINILNNNTDPLNFLYQMISKRTKWDIWEGNHGFFNFPGGVIPRPVNPVLGNFQYASYRCPTCGNNLYKVIFPEGNDPHLVFNETTGDAISPARMFTCVDCLSYFATPKGFHLNDNNSIVITAQFRNTIDGIDMYDAWFEVLNSIGGLNAHRNV